MKLYHYYERENGPFRSISELPDREAETVLQSIRTDHPDIFLARRPEDYLQNREPGSKFCGLRFCFLSEANCFCVNSH